MDKFGFVVPALALMSWTTSCAAGGMMGEVRWGEANRCPILQLRKEVRLELFWLPYIASSIRHNKAESDGRTAKGNDATTHHYISRDKHTKGQVCASLLAKLICERCEWNGCRGGWSRLEVFIGEEIGMRLLVLWALQAATCSQCSLAKVKSEISCPSSQNTINGLHFSVGTMPMAHDESCHASEWAGYSAWCVRGRRWPVCKCWACRRRCWRSCKQERGARGCAFGSAGEKPQYGTMSAGDFTISDGVGVCPTGLQCRRFSTSCEIGANCKFKGWQGQNGWASLSKE